jgi:hypothetical protein
MGPGIPIRSVFPVLIQWRKEPIGIYTQPRKYKGTLTISLGIFAHADFPCAVTAF